MSQTVTVKTPVSRSPCMIQTHHHSSTKIIITDLLTKFSPPLSPWITRTCQRSKLIPYCRLILKIQGRLPTAILIRNSNSSHRWVLVSSYIYYVMFLFVFNLILPCYFSSTMLTIFILFCDIRTRNVSFVIGHERTAMLMICLDLPGLCSGLVSKRAFDEIDVAFLYAKRNKKEIQHCQSYRFKQRIYQLMVIMWWWSYVTGWPVLNVAACWPCQSQCTVLLASA